MSSNQRFLQQSITTNPPSSANLQQLGGGVEEQIDLANSSSSSSSSSLSSINVPTSPVRQNNNQDDDGDVGLSSPHGTVVSDSSWSSVYSPRGLEGQFNEGIELEPYSISKKPSFDSDDGDHQHHKKDLAFRDSEMHPDPEGKTLYDIKDIGWQGKKTIRLMGERYFFGIIVATAVSFAIYILSLPNWTGGTTPETYFNIKTYSIFMQFGLFSFGSFYVTVSLTVAYGMERMRKSKMNLYMQKTESHPPTRDHRKARMVAINYTAPDIVVTVFTVVYMFFLLPVYFSIDNNIIRLGWRLVVHPIYWMIVVIVARQFLTRDISTDDIMLNSNIVLHTFFHHQTLGRIFVFTFQGDGVMLTLIGMAVSAIEDVLIRCIALKRDELVCRFFHGPERAQIEVYSQQNLQLRSAIINIQCALEFSGLISAPIFIYLFQQHRQLFHFFDEANVDPFTLFYLALISIILDLLSETLCTYVEVKYFKLPHKPTWKWMKDNMWFFGWLVYGSVTMGLFAMLWTCGRTARAFLCTEDNICTCGTIMASGLPSWCSNYNYTIVPTF
ncbi:hypothetical protein DFA_01764 [Cavenderia fasciculata]|uniref:Transmembrane protein n=1 Tax=Cavenderia fasciculata TaxID=261658 RepID=F4PUL4_CACFS|nr:uncharacterized protein DFA_01764 [Cavenderia fasciculata]EGG21878.1 hypothetical protein DFA_01764 [Cavenderia fasciculata]|eukprot:XP_004359729.1 hypothetical protein DFA_01764 [Cavenderia fasciculata]